MAPGSEGDEPARVGGAPELDEGHPQRWLVLASVLLGQFLIVGAVGTVNIALPSIQRGLGASDSETQWVLVLYQLGFALLLVTGGRLGDLWGRRRVFLLGLSGFVASSAVAANVPNPEILMAARLLQGVSGGITSPQVLAVIQVAFPAHERPRAFAAFGTVAGSAFMIGQVFSGGLIRLDLLDLGWRTPFLLNVVLGGSALLISRAVLPESGTTIARRLDLTGVLLVSTGGVLLLFPLIQGRSAGWPPGYLVLLAAAAPVLVAFVVYERRLSRHGGDPLLDTGLFRARSFSAGLVIALVFSFSTLPTFYVVTQALQLGFGFDPLEAALATAPTPLAVVAASMLSSRLLPRLGRSMMAVSALCGLTASVVLMATVHLGPRPLQPLHLVPALILLGGNNGFGMTTLVNLTLADVPNDRAGAASGTLQTVQQASAALGVALAGIVFFGVAGGAADLTDYVDGLTATLLVTVSSGLLVLALHRQLPALPGGMRVGTGRTGDADKLGPPLH